MNTHVRSKHRQVPADEPRRQELQLRKDIRKAVDRYRYIDADKQFMLRRAQTFLHVYASLGFDESGHRQLRPPKQEVALQVLTLELDKGRALEILADPYFKELLEL